MTHFVIARSEATKQSSLSYSSLAIRSWIASLRSQWATAPQRSVPDGQITCPAPTTKINAFVFEAKHRPNRAVSSHQGALAIVTDAGRDAMDVDGTADERC